MKRLVFGLGLCLITQQTLSQTETLTTQDSISIKKIKDLFFALRSYAVQIPIKMDQDPGNKSSIIVKRKYEAEREQRFINTIVFDYLAVLTLSEQDSIQRRKDLEKIAKAIHSLRLFLHEKAIAEPIVLPIKYRQNEVYKHLTDIQRQYTYVVYSPTDPEKIQLYVFVYPQKKLNSTEPGILSWILAYSYGHFFFEDLMGEKGVEFLLEGVKRPTNRR